MRILFYSKRLTVIVVLATLLAALPAAQAEGPEARAWSPHVLKAPVTGLALAADGVTLVAITQVPQEETPDGGSGTSVGTWSPGSAAVVVFNHTTGFRFNGTDGEDYQNSLAGFKTATAATADGRWVYASGPDFGEDILWGYRTDAPASGTDVSGKAYHHPDRRIPLPGPAAAIAASATGARVAVASNATDGTGHVLFLDGDGNEQRRFPLSDDPAPGPLHDLAASRDGSIVVAGGRASPGNDTTGAVLVLSPTQGLLHRYTLPNASFGDVVDVAVTEDGSRFAALTRAGVILTFVQAGRDTADPTALPLPTGNGTALALSGDGSVLAAGGLQDLAVLKWAPDGALAPAWNATAPGRVNDLDVDRAGNVIIAATGSGALAYGVGGPQEFWRLPGATTEAEVNANGTYVAFAQGKRVYANFLHEGLRFRFHSGEPLGSDTVDAKAAAPFGTVTYEAFVRNEGARVSTYHVNVPSVPGVTYRATPETLELAPGKSGNVSIAVTPGRLGPATYAYNVTATIPGTDFRQNLTVPFTVLPETRIKVSVAGAPDRSIDQEDNDSILVGIQNEGNEANGIRVGVSQDPSEGSDWNVYVLGNSEFTLPPGASSSVRLRVEPPDRVENGTINRITILVTGADGTTVTETVTYRVNPVTNVKVDAPARTKLIYPGEHQQFNLTAENTGSVPAQFVAEWDALRDQTTGNGAWVLSLDLNPFRLEPGETRDLPVRVFAPASSQEGDHARFRITVRTVPLQPGDTSAESSVNITATVVERKATANNQSGGPNTIPAPSLALLAVAALGAAQALGRRRT